MKFQKILVPVDGSEHSRNALQCALDLAQSQGAHITLLHCHEHIPRLIAGAAREELARELRAEAGKLLEPFAVISREAGVDPGLMVREGRPAQAIVEEARKGGYDLIVMGSRGLSEVAGVLLGSVAHRVMAAAHCPVLVTR